MLVFRIIKIKFVSNLKSVLVVVIFKYLPTNASELRLFLGIVNFYVRVFPYLFIVQNTWEGPVALHGRNRDAILSGW